MTTENYMDSGASAGQSVLSNIKSRFVIVIVLSILVSSALSSLYSVDNSTVNMAYLAILTPVFFVLGYTFFEILKSKISDSFLKVISIELLTGITSFVFPLTFVAFFKTVASLGMLMKIILNIAVWGVPLVGLLTLLTILAAGVLGAKKQ
jgi:hypothetical protein